MTDHDANLAAALNDLYPVPTVEPDWRAVKGGARSRRRLIVPAVVLILIVVFGVLPALGVGRDTLWLQSPDQKIAGYIVAQGDSQDGHWELRASQGFWLGTSAWLDGRFWSKSAGSSESLHGRGTDGPRYVGFYGGNLGAHTQFVFGALAREVARVDLALNDGSTTQATIVPAPEQVGTDLRFYYAVMPVKPCITAVIGYDTHGNELERHDVWTRSRPPNRCS